MNKIDKGKMLEPPELGKWGDPLPNMRELTQSEFLQTPFFFHTPSLTGSRQIVENGKLKAAVRWFMNEDGSGLVFARTGETGQELKIYSWAKCIHKFGPPVNVGRCLNQYTCTLCNYVNEVDSSD